MQALFSLFIFSLLLATAACLECETCIPGSTCSKQNCGAGQDTCLTLTGEVTAGQTTTAIVLKSCFSKDACDLLKTGGSYDFGGSSIKIKDVTCKAAPSSASFLFVLSGFLLLKTFF